MRYDPAKLYLLMQVIGIIGFVTGLTLHIFTYTKAIPPEKKKTLGIVAVLQMIVGGTMAMWPWMLRFIQS